MGQILYILTIILVLSCGQKNNNVAIEKKTAIKLDKLIADNYQLTFTKSDSFPTTDIYGDLAIRSKLTDSIENMHQRAKIIQSYLKNKFGDYFDTTDSTVILKLNNGKTLSFLNWDYENEEGYTFEHYFDKINYFLLRVQLFEGNYWMLVNRQNGLKKYISGLPYISKDNKKIITINTDLIAEYSFNGIEFYTILADSLKEEFFIETKWGPQDIKWINENEFLLKREHLPEASKIGIEENIIDYKRVKIEKKTIH